MLWFTAVSQLPSKMWALIFPHVKPAGLCRNRTTAWTHTLIWHGIAQTKTSITFISLTQFWKSSHKTWKCYFFSLSLSLFFKKLVQFSSWLRSPRSKNLEFLFLFSRRSWSVRPALCMPSMNDPDTKHSSDHSVQKSHYFGRRSMFLTLIQDMRDWVSSFIRHIKPGERQGPSLILHVSLWLIQPHGSGSHTEEFSSSHALSRVYSYLKLVSVFNSEQ